MVDIRWFTLTLTSSVALSRCYRVLFFFYQACGRCNRVVKIAMGQPFLFVLISIAWCYPEYDTVVYNT